MTQIRTESLDFEAALRRHGTVRQLKQAARKILDDCQTHLVVIHHATTVKDAQNLERLAHHLVDTLTELSPPAALDIALLLERQGRSGILIDTQQTINQLKRELERLKSTIVNL